MKNKWFYKRKLPHWQPPGSDFFITYRLAGSIPVNILEQLNKKDTCNFSVKIKKVTFYSEEIFLEFETQLEERDHGPKWLADPRISKIVFESLLFNNNKEYKLWAACIMSNHVHIVISTNKESRPLNSILQNHKKFTALQSNKVLNRKGQFWAEESFDTLMRNKNQLYSCIQYCINNPVQAGLVPRWRDWPWTYLDPGLQNLFK